MGKMKGLGRYGPENSSRACTGLKSGSTAMFSVCSRFWGKDLVKLSEIAGCLEPMYR